MRCIALAVLFAIGCGPQVMPGTDGNGGDDSGGGGDDSGGGGDDAQMCGALAVTYRDFQVAHPDMEETVAVDRGLVMQTLGLDGKPQYAPAGATQTVSGKASFDQWYRDVAGVNMTFAQTLPLVQNPPGTFTFDDQDFFPLDNMGFGNEGNAHNFHFTSEIHGTFKYRGGEVFQFIGDDDVFVFVNKKLALDIGGVHGPEMQMVNFDQAAATLGITIGGTYQLDVFHAERHLSQSTFRMVTTIDCFIIQ